MNHNLQEKTIQEFLEKRRPPKEIRSQLDVGATYENSVVEIFEIRPRWDNPKEILHLPVAKSKYIKSKKIWKIYWMRGNGKWVLYEPKPEVTHLSEFLDTVGEDELGCFWG